MRSRPWFLPLVVFLWHPGVAPAQSCGGTERWAVKVAADPDAQLIDAQPHPTTLHDLVQLTRPASLPGNGTTRLSVERTVWVLDARLVAYKQETGKDGDRDFHLVISDETLLSTPAGPGTASPHSFIAEIPDPACVAGEHGDSPTPSRFAAELASTRAAFLQRFPLQGMVSGTNDANGIPVRLTGVGFFDRDHNQLGRARNGIELHPLLAIEFNPAGFNPNAAAVVAAPLAFANPSFESGDAGWHASARVITNSADQPNHSGTWKAWLGGYSTVHRDTVWQAVALPASPRAVGLSFYLHIETEETGKQAFDQLWVRVRTEGGTLLRTVGTFSNQQAAAGFTRQTFDLTPWRGRTVRVSLEARNDAGAITSFVVDDFALTLEP